MGKAPSPTRYIAFGIAYGDFDEMESRLESLFRGAYLRFDQGPVKALETLWCDKKRASEEFTCQAEPFCSIYVSDRNTHEQTGSAASGKPFEADVICLRITRRVYIG